MYAARYSRDQEVAMDDKCLEASNFGRLRVGFEISTPSDSMQLLTQPMLRDI